MRPKPRQMSWNFGRKKWVKTKSSPDGRDGVSKGREAVKSVRSVSIIYHPHWQNSVSQEYVTTEHLMRSVT